MGIKINKSQNEIEIVKDSTKEYKKIYNITNSIFFILIIIIYVALKISNSFNIFNVIILSLGGAFLIYFTSSSFKNEHINEILKISLEGIKLKFLKDEEIIYSKEIPRDRVIKIKKEIQPFKLYGMKPFGKDKSVNIMNEELVDKRLLKIITKDEVFSWGYKVEEEKIDEIIKLIKEFWNIEN